MGEVTMDRRDRLHELCGQITNQNDPMKLLDELTEIDDILGSILTEVEHSLCSVDRQLENP